MMSKTTFIILEKSYLIRKGLSGIIEKIPNTKILQEYDNEDDLITLTNLDTDFIISNPLFIELINPNLISDNKLISLSAEKPKLNKKIEWIEHIFLDDTQKNIIKKLNNIIGNKVSKESSPKIPEEISKREADILKNIALGYSNKEIADKLFISTHTVVTHRKNITRKLGIKTAPGLTIYAILNKLININDTDQSIS